MQKISDSTNTANPAGEFAEGNPAAGVPATLIKASWLNAIQRELAGLVLGAGISLSATDDSQVLKAVKALAGVAADFNKLTNKPTTLGGYGITDAFTKPETVTAIQQAISSLVASSPEALDTLNELAAALGNDPNFATTMTNALAGKANKATTLGGYGIADAYTKAQVDASLAGKANKATTLAGYGITDALAVGSGGWLSYAPAITGPIAGITGSQLFSGAGGATTDGPAAYPNSVGLHMVFANPVFGADIAVSINEAVGNLLFRNVGGPAPSGWRVVWHDGNFTPSSKISGNNCSAAGFAGGDKASPYMAHADGATVLLATAGASFGVGQTWQDVTASRARDVSYTNTTARPIAVSISPNTATRNVLTLAVSGLAISRLSINDASIGALATVSAIVPPGASYTLTSETGSAIGKWLELK